MSEFQRIFKKVNGGKVLKEYAYAHVLLHALTMTVIEGTSKKSLEIVRESVSNKIVRRLRRKYAHFIAEFKKNNGEKNLFHKHSKRVWVCWLQGMENAPEIVKKCYQSLIDNLEDREIILLTKDNYRDWVTFPKYIQDKMDNGIITPTHMTDFLRLKLLEDYGGTWIDATVFCSGNNCSSYVLDSDFFIYQIMKPGLDAHAQRISSWFITACTNHPIIILVRELLYEYWKFNDRLIDYFLIHDFFELAIEAYPEEWNKVIPVSNSTSLILMLRLFDQYEEKIWESIKEQTPFHKLSYKIEDDKMKMKNTYYSEIIRGGVDYRKLNILVFIVWIRTMMQVQFKKVVLAA